MIGADPSDGRTSTFTVSSDTHVTVAAGVAAVSPRAISQLVWRAASLQARTKARSRAGFGAGGDTSMRTTAAMVVNTELAEEMGWAKSAFRSRRSGSPI